MQARLRLEMLEKTVAGYKDMCASLEKELQSVKSSPDHGKFSQNKKLLTLLRMQLQVTVDKKKTI